MEQFNTFEDYVKACNVAIQIAVDEVRKLKPRYEEETLLEWADRKEAASEALITAYTVQAATTVHLPGFDLDQWQAIGRRYNQCLDRFWKKAGEEWRIRR